MQDQAEANYRWFKDHLDDLMTAHRGRHALLHDQDAKGFFASSLEAIKVGLVKYGEGNFSVESVDDTIEDLGFFSHVSSALRA